jgi:hypothetical protein
MDAEREYRGYGFRARSLSDKIDVVNFAQSARPGMTAGHAARRYTPPSANATTASQTIPLAIANELQL